MSQLSELTGTGVPDVIPGHVISPVDLDQMAAVELYLESLHRASCENDAVPMNEKQRNSARQQADAAIASGLLSAESPFFNGHMNRKSIVQFLLWINLRVATPGITFDETKKLLKKLTDGRFHQHPYFWKIRKAVLEKWGFNFGDTGDGKNVLTPPSGPVGQQIGTESTNSFAENAVLAPISSGD